MSEYDGEPEPTCDVIVAHDFEHPERVGTTESVPLSQARRMVREGQARYADQPDQPVPEWYRRVNDLPSDDAPQDAAPTAEPEPAAAESPAEAEQDSTPPHRARKSKTAEE